MTVGLCAIPHQLYNNPKLQLYDIQYPGSLDVCVLFTCEG